MGIDYYNCELCGVIFADCGYWGYCGNCESMMCGDCYEVMAKKNGVLGEEHENAVDFGEDAPNCCDKCDGTILDEESFVDFLIAKLGKSREELVKEFRKEAK